MSQTIHYLSHNPGGFFIFLCRSISSRPVDKIVHGYDRDDLSCDYVRGRLRYQYTIHSYFINQVEMLTVMIGLEICIIPATIPPITYVGVVYCWFYLLIFIIEVYMGLIPATCIPQNLVDNTVPTQVSINIIFLGVCEYKLFKTVIRDVAYFHIKIILIILIQAFHHTLIQACRHTLFVRVRISLIILFIHLMELYTILVYHPLSIYIIHHTVFFPHPCHQTYLLLICSLVCQIG